MLLSPSIQAPAVGGIVSCQNFVIDVPEYLCQNNISAAQSVLQELQKSAMRISKIDEWKVNRFIICGHCSLSGIDSQEVERLFRAAMKEVVDRICEYEDGGSDVSEMKRKERNKKHYEKNKIAISERQRQRRAERGEDSRQLAYG